MPLAQPGNIWQQKSKGKLESAGLSDALQEGRNLISKPKRPAKEGMRLSAQRKQERTHSNVRPPKLAGLLAFPPFNF